MIVQVLTAPNDELPEDHNKTIFLAGGITNCPQWQEKVIKELEMLEPINAHATVFNPRRKDFSFNNTYEVYQQIKWEFDRLEQMDIFSMYFCDADSVQPICLYELGRNIVRMQNRFPNDWKDRIVISIEPGYTRKDDVLIQMDLCAPGLFIDTNGSPELHAYNIKIAYVKLSYFGGYRGRG